MKKQIGLLLLCSICLSSSLIGQVRDSTLRQLVKRDLRHAIFGNEGALQAIETNLINPEAKISGILHPKGALGKSILSLGFKAKIDENFISVFSKNTFNNTLSLKFRWDFIPFIDKKSKEEHFKSFIHYQYNKAAMLGLPEMIAYTQAKDVLLYDSLIVLGFLVHNQIDKDITYKDYALHLRNTQVSKKYIEYTKLFKLGKTTRKEIIEAKEDGDLCFLDSNGTIQCQPLHSKGKIKSSIENKRAASKQLIIKTNVLGNKIKEKADQYKPLLEWAYGKYLTFSLDSLPSTGAYTLYDLGQTAVNLKKPKITAKDKAKILEVIFNTFPTINIANDKTYFIINKDEKEETVFKIKIKVDSLVLKYKSVEHALKYYDKKIIQYEIKQTDDAWTQKKVIWFSFEPNFKLSSFSYGNSSLLTKSIDSINIVDSFSIDASVDFNLHIYKSWQNSNLYVNFGLSPGLMSNKNNLRTTDYSRSLSTTDTTGSINTVYGQTKNGTMYHGELLQGLGVKLSFNFVYNFTRGVLSPGIFLKQEASFSSIFKTTKGMFFNTEVGLVFNFLDREKKNTYISLVPYIGITNLFINVETSGSTSDNKEYQAFGDKYLIGIKVGLPIHFKPNKNKTEDLMAD